MEGVRGEEEIKENQKELEDPKLEVADLRQKLTLQTEVNELLTSKLQEAESVSDGLSNKVNEKESELSHLVKEHEVQGTQSSKFITELEEQLRAYRSKIKTLQGQKRDLEAQLESKAVDATQLDEKNKEVSARTTELEQVLKEKGDEMIGLLKRQKDNENHLKSKIEELMVQFSILQLEVDHLRAQEGEVEVSLQQGLESTHCHKAESDAILESESRELSELLIQVNAPKDDLAMKTQAEQKMMKEKEALLMQVMDLESDVDSLHKQNNDLEEQMRIKSYENVGLREENERLHVKILELEGRLSSREDELSALLNREGEHMPGDVDQIKNHTISSDSPNDEAREELLKGLPQMEDENVELRSKIDELEKRLTEREAAMNCLVEESKQFKRLSTESKLNYQSLERKLERLAEEFRKKLEDNIRLLFQRIKVAEKMHYENKENHKRMKETLEQENASLIEKLAAFEGEGMKLRDSLEPRNKEIETKDGKLEDAENLLTSISSAENELVLAKACATQGSNKTEDPTASLDDMQDQELQLVEKVRKLESQLSEEEGNKLSMLKVVSELKERVMDLEKDIEQKSEMLVGLREEKSEAIRELGEENEEAIKQLEEERREAIRQLDEERRETIRQLEAEQGEAIRQLGEEKREAIRQLCLLVDHHRSRFESLQQLIPNVAVRHKKRT